MKGRDRLLLFRSIHGASPVGGSSPPPAHAAARRHGRPRRLAPVPGAGRKPQRRTDGSNRTVAAPARRAQVRNSVFPVYAGPLRLPPMRDEELSGVPEREPTRRQSRTGHGRKDKGETPGSSGPSTALPSTPRQRATNRRGGSHDDHRGRIAPPTPAARHRRFDCECQEGGPRKFEFSTPREAGVGTAEVFTPNSADAQAGRRTAMSPNVLTRLDMSWLCVVLRSLSRRAGHTGGAG